MICHSCGSKKLKKYFLKFGISLLFTLSQAGYAWSAQYHEAIVKDAMTQVDPKTKRAMRVLLGPMPASVWSTWADDVRSKDRSYSRWHHIHVDEIDKPCQDRENIKCGILLSVDVLRGKSEALPKDVALKLLLHLVADVHQPLHVSMPKFYNGKCFFKHNKTYSFHRFMDYEVVRKSYRGVSDVADIISSVRLFEDIKVGGTVSDWLHQTASYQYMIMPNLKKGNVPTYCKTGKSRVEPIDLNSDQIEVMAQISWLQMARASKRLAYMLDDIFLDGIKS